MKTVGHVRSQHELEGQIHGTGRKAGATNTQKKQEITPNSSQFVMLNMIPAIIF